MNVLIFGGGAIGCHIGYCMYKTGHSVNIISRGQHYKVMKEQGVRIQIFDNQNLENDEIIKEDENFKVVDDLAQVDDVEFDYLFITVKLADYNEKTLKKLSPILVKTQLLFHHVQKCHFGGFSIWMKKTIKNMVKLILTLILVNILTVKI